MKKLFLTIFTFALLGAPLLAGPGHDHGEGAFLNAGSSNSFDLSDYQIANLQLKSEKIKNQKFFETVTMPVVLRRASSGGWTAQGFMFEGKDILQIKQGQKASIKIDAIEGKKLEGKITSIDTMMDPKTRLFSAHAQVTSAVPANAQGLKGEMTVQTTYTETALGVPVAALQGEFGNYFVFVRKGNHFERRPVAIGHASDSYVEILQGVQAGEELVTLGSYQLQYVTGSDEHDHDHEEPAQAGPAHKHEHGEECTGNHGHNTHEGHDHSAHEAGSHEGHNHDSHDHDHDHDDHNHAHDNHDGHDHGEGFWSKVKNFFSHSH